MSPAGRDRSMVKGVCRWFGQNARPLPWRTPAPRDPYLSLVSEFMLQQTQVSRVLERWGEFIRRFPTVEALAKAKERNVLACWSGLGYYRRARNLHAAARSICSDWEGRVPASIEELRTLPGVGRYTAGAIASMVFGRAEALVDGNVARVLVRVEGKDLAANEIERWAWQRAMELVRAAAPSDVGGFNEGLMELGAVVCTPRRPRCAECPVGRLCKARIAGIQEQLPPPKPRAARSSLFCASVVVRERSRTLVEQRGDRGLWAGLWQAPTIESPRRPTRAQIEAWWGARGLTKRERFTHGTTHRIVEFEVWEAQHHGSARDAARWMTRSQIERLGLSNPQRRILLGTASG